ncbi:MAG TPA: class I SAM-dependent methyltransferase [Methylomirabilota bacterium]|nr:class I SAM-dependent methyltransferase [Methylomirabilota bacterium]
MNPDEYLKLADIENRHWFYVGKRVIVRHWINRVRPLQSSDRLVDCGAGTGTFAAEMARFCRVEAVDDHEESLILARQRLSPDQVKRGTCVNLPYPDASVDVLTALDVIEHVADDHKAMAEFSRVLKPNGVAVITVPALQALWSDWDVVLHHFRRYTRRGLLDAVAAGDFEVAHIAYINVAVLPLVYAIRKWRGLQARLGLPPSNRSEDSIPPEPVNGLLRWLFVSTATQSLVRFPAGVGLLAVLRKRP